MCDYRPISRPAGAAHVLLPPREGSSTVMTRSGLIHDDAGMKRFHAVRFYESTQSLAATAAVFFGAGLTVDEPAFVIACPEHQIAIEEMLRDISFSLVALRRSHKLHVVDARRTLRELIVNGVPDPVRFSAVMDRELGGLKQSSEGGGVRIYDEMTDVLWKQGRYAAALQLEALWDALTVHTRCSVLCGHSIDARPDKSALTSLCSSHSHIVGPNGAPHPMQRVKAVSAGPGSRRSRSVH
jgi:hypothetical protein